MHLVVMKKIKLISKFNGKLVVLIFTIFEEKATLNKVETIKCLKIYGNILVINIIETFSGKDTPVR